MIAIVKSSFNSKITDGLYKGCISALNQNGFSDDKIETHIVPGAFEIPYQTKKLLSKKHSLYQAVITLGCVIKGETDHYDYIADAVTKGIMDISINSQIPILYGVLTCQNSELAHARSSDDMKKNKGFEVAIAALEMIK